MKHRSAFTLIELLVVVTIIAILASLLIAGLPILQRNAKVLVSTQRIEQVVSNLNLIAENEGGAAMRLTWGSEIKPGLKLGDLAEGRNAYPALPAPFDQCRPFRTFAPWGKADLFDRELDANGATPEARRIQRLHCWIDPLKAPVPAPYDAAFTPLFSSELLALASVIADPAAYRTDRNPNRPWNDRWGNPLAVSLLLFEPRIAPDGGDFKGFMADPANAQLAQSFRQSPSQHAKDPRPNPFQNERVWSLCRDRYGYNRVLYVMVAAACSSIPVDKTAPADPQRVWDETCRRFAEDGMLWDSQAQIDPPYTGVGKFRRRGVSLLSAPTVLR